MQICSLYIFGNKPPQMVPRDLNIGFQGLALILQPWGILRSADAFSGSGLKKPMGFEWVFLHIFGFLTFLLGGVILNPLRIGTFLGGLFWWTLKMRFLRHKSHILGILVAPLPGFGAGSSPTRMTKLTFLGDRKSQRF